MWIGSFSTAFIHVAQIHRRSLHASTALRSSSFYMARKSYSQNPHTTASSVHMEASSGEFWTSLFGLLLGVIAVGATCHIFHKQVSATVPGQSTVTTSVGSLLYDRFMNQERAHMFFKDTPTLTYSLHSSTDLRN
ncbi:hypothetical protein NECAME_00959, partial [Necator americanus]